MPVVGAGQVFADRAGVGDHHTHKADFDDGLGDHLDRGKQAVEVVGALHQHLQLATAQAAGAQEAIGHLEVVVVGLRVWLESPPTTGAMISPEGSEGPSWTVTTPIRSSRSLITTGVKPPFAAGMTSDMLWMTVWSSRLSGR